MMDTTRWMDRHKQESLALQEGPRPGRRDRSSSSERALRAIDDVSRRIDVLARELKCLGYFDDGDGPRAA